MSDDAGRDSAGRDSAGRDSAGRDSAGRDPGPSGAEPNAQGADIAAQLVAAFRKERREARYWKYGFRGVVLAALVALALSGPWDRRGVPPSNGHTALVRMEGALIASEFGDDGAEAIVTGLRNAFEHENTEAVVLLINSPGGSPVQAAYIYDEIRWLRARHADIPIHAVIEDIGASAAYYVASACERIHAGRASLVGSIGVISGGFGFVETLEKMGIERRRYTAGDAKGMLDPFLPEKPSEVAAWQDILDDLHRQFSDSVRAGRGARLSDHPEIFSGMVWSGEKALEFGLIDGLGNLRSVLRDVIKQTNLVDFTVRQEWYERLGRELGRSALRGALEWLSAPRLGEP